MLSLAFIFLAVWALTVIGVVALCVAARRVDKEIAGERSVPTTRAAARVPARAFSRVIPR
jgi:hypothetical protein